MSRPSAIAATTATLRNLLLARIPVLDTELSDLEVTAQPPDLARKSISKAQLNLFLYQTVHNAAWSNLDAPDRVRAGEQGRPPLAINLRYLITAYGRGDSDNDALSHRVLGGAMSTLHDHPVLGRDELQLALPASDLAAQFERLRVTPLSLSVEELSKLWTMFQTQYRVSAFYEVTVVLIDSSAPPQAALPVLSVGLASVAAPAPRLTGFRAPFSQAAARLGEDLVLEGAGLNSRDAKVHFTSTRLAAPVVLAPLPDGSSSALKLHLSDESEDPGALARWAPGNYTCTLSIEAPGEPALFSNPVSFALAPRISVTPTSAAAGSITLKVSCRPRIVEGQYVRLVVGAQAVAPAGVDTPPDTSKPSTLTFALSGVAAGTYLLRLRVDGVDSIPVRYTGTPARPEFDPAQQLGVT